VKPISEQDHYEILEAGRGSAREEIERAYKLAMATYADDSLAGYSIFLEGDAEAVRERIESAYRVLADPEARRAYDASLAAIEPAPPPPRRPASTLPLQLPMDELEEIEEEEGEFDGARLRRTRLRRGLELEDIGNTTKINPSYLAFIEEERFDALPAAVYVRGFVMAFATCLGLDAGQVGAGYMQRYEAQRNPSRRRR